MPWLVPEEQNDYLELHSAMNALTRALQSRANEDLVLHTANQVFVRPGLSLQSDFLDIATADHVLLLLRQILPRTLTKSLV